MQKSKSLHWIVFFLQPFLTLLYYLSRYRNPFSKNIIWFFTIYFSATIAIGVESQGSDINVYMADVELMSEVKDLDGVIAFYENSGEVDVFRTFFAFLISRITQNGYIYIIFLGAIFGYFYSRNLWMVIEVTKGKFKPYLIPLVFCLFLVIPIWNMGGFRFWTAAHIFLFGLLGYFLKNSKKSLIWIFVVPFIFHYAFIVPCIVVFLYLIAGNRLNFYFYLFLISIVLGEINLSKFNAFIETYMPQELVDRSSSYRLDEKVEEYRLGVGLDNVVWYAKYLKYFLNWPVYSFLIITFLYYRKQITKKPLLNLFNFTLLFYTFANFSSSLPSGSRYLDIAAFLALSFFIVLIQNDNRVNTNLVKIIKVSTPILLIFIVIQFRQSLYLTSVFTLIGNPITAIFLIGDNFSLNDLIK